MLTDRDKIILETLRQRTLPVLQELANVPDNCCILASRVGQEVLRHYKLAAQCLCVDLIVQTAEARVVVGAQRPTIPQPGVFYGHIVLWAGSAILIDLTLKQAAHVDETLTAVMFELRDLEIMNTEHGTAITLPSGTHVGYRRSKNTSWRFMPDWTERPRRNPAIQQLIHEVDEQLVTAGL